MFSLFSIGQFFRDLLWISRHSFSLRPSVDYPVRPEKPADEEDEAERQAQLGAHLDMLERIVALLQQEHERQEKARFEAQTRMTECLLSDFDQQLSALDQALSGLDRELHPEELPRQQDERQQLVRRLFVLAGLDPELLSMMMEDEHNSDSVPFSFPFSFSDDYFDSDSDSTSDFFAGFNDYFDVEDDDYKRCIDLEALRRRLALLVPAVEGLMEERSEERSEEWDSAEYGGGVEW